MSLSKENLLHIIAAEIEELYGVTIPEHTDEEKIVYPLSAFMAGLFRKKLHVYFVSGKAVNYKVHYFIFNRKIF